MLKDVKTDSASKSQSLMAAPNDHYLLTESSFVSVDAQVDIQ
jgi:hypothetical protein